MSYCLNPVCPSPQNSDDAEVCQCGTRLRLNNRYRALKPIGQGGFGRTFLAVDLAKDQKPLCVIKQFFPNAGIDRAKASELFREEAKRLKQLSTHSQIPNLLDDLEQDGQQYLIQEFIDGQTLEQELQTQGAFNETQIRQLLLDLLPVLQFMHGCQVIHRDIKPANIIRRSLDRELVLVDLGAAKYATGTAIAKTGTVIGSAEYIAPEQTRGKAVFASDLYSLGATCVHLLTQMSPFDLFDSSDDRWVWRDYLAHPVSNSLEKILDRMLKSATNQRYRSASEVLIDLNRTEQQSERFEPAIASRSAEFETAQAERKIVHSDINFEEGGQVVAVDRDREKLQRRKTQRKLIWQLFNIGIFASIPLFWFPLFSDTLFWLFAQQAQNVFESIDPSSRSLISSGIVDSIAMSADNRTLANVSLRPGDDLIYDIEVWNLETSQKIVSSLPVRPNESTVISPDGKALVSYGVFGEDSNNQVRVWSLQTGGLVHLIQTGGVPSTAVSVAISPDSQTFFIANDRTIEEWDMQTGKRIRTLRPSNNRINSIALSPDGKTLVSTESFGAIVAVWDLKTGNVVRSLQTNLSHQPETFANQTVITSDGFVVVVGNEMSARFSAEVWDLETGVQVRKLDLGSQPIAVAVSRNGTLAVYKHGTVRGTRAGGISRNFELWNIKTGERIRTISAPSNLSKRSLIFSPDGKRLIFASDRFINIVSIDILSIDPAQP